MSKSRYLQSRAGGTNIRKLLPGGILFLGLVYWISGYFMAFDANKLVENSVLKDRSFNTAVKEVVSPEHKIKAYLFEDKTNPIISVNFIFKNAGSAYDGDSEQGIANMAAELLTDGAGDMNRLQFKEELENLAVSIGFSAERDDMSGSLLATKPHAERAFVLLETVLTDPRFDLSDIRQVKAEMLVMLKQQNERPERILALAADKVLFGSHPYGRNSLGEAEDIQKITRRQLKNYVRDHFVRQNLVVGIAGDMTADEAGMMLDKVFGRLPRAGKTAVFRPAETDFAADDKHIEADLPQSIARLAAPGVIRQDKDFYPLYAANHILGGAGLTSRLSLAAREDEALTYGVYTYMNTAEKAPLLTGGFSATPENFSRVKEIVETEWQKMGESGVSKEELDAAKDYLLASYHLRFASIQDIARMLTAMQKENLGMDFLQKRNEYIRNIKLHEVNTAAKKYFNIENLRFITIGKVSAEKE